ncbi:squamosa promoter-binding-like protein 9 [Curcuma longa]|uniref:squamosa promoter-binding-like protein 9 n=1 Tax=Curcuma longa TaxID=136217 RepID=UPI003D9F2EA1
MDEITQDADHCVRDLINQPGSLLLGRGSFLIYLSNTIIHVLQDGTTLTNIKMEVRPPRLHYVYPAYLEAGKPLEFVACGSNLRQPKFRLLLSFCGKYLKHEVQQITCSEHEMFRIKVTHTDLEVFGPAFVEVENVSGLSNFIPVLVGSKDICSELKRIEDVFTGSCYDGNFVFHVDSSVSCNVLMSRQYYMSTLLLDIAWVLKTPHPEDKEHFWSLINVDRITTLLKFLLPNKCLSILRVIVCHLDDIILVKGFDKPESWTSNADLKRFHEYLNHAKAILSQEKLYDFRSAVEPRNSVSGSLMLQSNFANQDSETIRESSFPDSLQANAENDVNVLLVTDDIIHRQHRYQNSFVDIFSNKTTRSQVPLFIAASVIVCLVVCTIVLHPRKAGEFAVSIRRCMSSNNTT